MKKFIKFEIDCGETTCAIVPGKFCKFVGAARFGTIPVCRLFSSSNDSYTELIDKDGWLQRCDSCLKGVLDESCAGQCIDGNCSKIDECFGLKK